MLAELYHIQPPLLPEDSSTSNAASSSVPTELSPQCGQPADQPTPTPTFTAADSQQENSFISRQQLGISDQQSAVATDSGLLEDALTASENAATPGTIQAQVLTAPAAGAEQPSPAPQQNQTKPLCSQEWKIQHVSQNRFMPAACMTHLSAMWNILSHCLSIGDRQAAKCDAAGHLPRDAHVPEAWQVTSVRRQRG